MNIALVYDNREAVPEAIGTIVRSAGFGGIVHRRQRLSDIMARHVAQAGLPLRTITSEDEQQRLVHELTALPADLLVARLPATLMPVDAERFVQVLRRLPFALHPAIFLLSSDEAVTLLRRDEAIGLLCVPDAAARRQMLLRLRDGAIDMAGACKFYDLRSVNDFLAFMAGATEARHFNHLERQKGIFRKSSHDKAKMRAEHDFFHVVPPAMKRFLIPTFDYCEEGDRASYAMEAMRLPDGALQIIHNSFNPEAVETLLDSFFAFIGARERRVVERACIRDAAEREMVAKLDQRLATLSSMGVGRRLDRLLAEGGLEDGLGGLHERARSVIRAEIDRDTTDHLALSHGDPCLSNILFNAPLSLFRLIDPRGATTAEDAMMHPIYDLAKLSHSLVGGYDFVNNGLFDCRLDEDLAWRLELDGGGPPAFIRQAFERRLAGFGWNQRLVRACEMSLFLSMLPLHIDAPLKLPAFALIAHGILQELEAK